METIKLKYQKALKETEEQLNNLAIQQQRIIGCLHALEEVEASAAAALEDKKQSDSED